MNRITKLAVGIVTAGALALGLSGCSSDAEVASHNISKKADNFEVMRRIVMFNGITDKYLMVIVGACSIEEDGIQLEVTCKLGKGQYVKHFLHLSDNVSYFVEQGKPVDVSTTRYQVVFKPASIVPDPDFKG